MAHIFVELDCRIPQPTTRPTQKPTDTNDQKMIAFEGMPPDVSYGTIASINDNEFIVASQHKTQNDGHIYKFNIHQKQWKKFAEYPKDTDISHPQIAFDKHTNKLYVTHACGLVINDINTDKWSSHVLPLCKHAQLINTNGIFHLFGNSKHFVWNNTNNAFEMIYDFDTVSENEIDKSSLVYVPSKNIILSLSQPYTRKYSKHTPVNIWTYCLMRNEWTQTHDIEVGIVSSYGISMAVLTSDENFIIFSASSREYSNSIYVLDIRDKNNYILTKSKCFYPRGHRMMAITGNKSKDECIVIGWIKKLFKSKQFSKAQIPPLHIMILISDWYNQEMVHWIQRKKAAKRLKKGHYGMYVKHILCARASPKKTEDEPMEAPKSKQSWMYEIVTKDLY
eukprot:273101_1